MLEASNLLLESVHTCTDKRQEFSNNITVEDITNYFYSNLTIYNSQKICFSEVVNEEELEKVMELRRKVYNKTNQYMLNEFDSAIDTFENRSRIYAAWLDGSPVASIRLTPYPFETMKFIDEEKLSQFLGYDFKENYLEWSRLIVDADIKNPAIMPSLIVYAGIKIFTNSNYTRYFGFTKPQVRRLLQKFYLSSDTIKFSIPSRNNNSYFLLKGCFYDDITSLINKRFTF